MPHRAAWTLHVLIQPGFLVALGRKHQVIKIILRRVLLEDREQGAELSHLRLRSRIRSPPHYIYRFFCFLSGISKCESRRVGAQLFIYVVQASVAHRGGAEERREA